MLDAFAINIDACSHSKESKSQEVLDYIQVPPLPKNLSRSDYVALKSSHFQLLAESNRAEFQTSCPESLKGSQQTLRAAGARAPGGRKPQKNTRKKKQRLSSPITTSAFPFVLTEDERSEIRASQPSTFSGVVNTETYLKVVFYIDIARVPNRKPRPLTSTGR